MNSLKIHADQMINDAYNQLLKEIDCYTNPPNLKTIHRAFELAYKAHNGQHRSSGEPYITHPLAVATILAQMRMDTQGIVAAILHDLLEDTSVSQTDLKKKFGQTITELVDGVSKLTHMNFKSYRQAQAENFQKMALAMTKDIRVVMIKLADRLHNMRTLAALKQHKRVRVAQETLDIYLPIAARLGMYRFKQELEDLCFMAIYPMRGTLLNRAVKKNLLAKEPIYRQITEQFKDFFHNAKIETTIQQQPKSLLSIYQKMLDNKQNFHQQANLLSLRFTVKNIDDCYRVLGLTHRLFKPLPRQFEDYIAITKPNGYQALHTKLLSPKGIIIFIQILTQNMEDIAEHGVAAYWMHEKSNQVLEDNKNWLWHWLANVTELQKHADSSIEFIENIKNDLFPTEIYVFTPKGDIYELPKNATPVDFAYNVHTAVGNTCIACRIDGKLTPLNQPLTNGQLIEIITEKNAQPQIAWLDFVVTTKARIGIRNVLKKQNNANKHALGERLLKNALVSFSLQLNNIHQLTIDQTIEQLKLESIDELFLQLGLGKQSAHLVAAMMAKHHSELQTKKPI